MLDNATGVQILVGVAIWLHALNDATDAPEYKLNWGNIKNIPPQTQFCIFRP